MMQKIIDNKGVVITSGSRVIPLRYLKGFIAGSLDCAWDDEFVRITKKAAEGFMRPGGFSLEY